VGETQAVDTVGGFELARGNRGRFVIGPDDGSVDGAFDLVPFDGHCNFLRDRLAFIGGFVNGCIGFSTASIQLEGIGSEAADDEAAVAISRAIEVALLAGTQVVTGDHYAVRMRVAVEVHILGFVEDRLDGVIAGGFVGRVPVGDGRAGNDMEAFASADSLALSRVWPVFSSLASILPVQPGAVMPPPATLREVSESWASRAVVRRARTRRVRML
jgi:hypothetical protein